MNKLQNLASRLRMIPDRVAAEVRRPQWWGFFVSVAAIAILSIAFFYPDASLGNELRQHDMQQGAAIGYEATAYAEATGEDLPRWTNSLFSGMPTFQISPSYPSDSLFGWINTVYGAGLPSPSNLLFMMMFGFLILMAAMRVRWYYGLIGAVAWGFSTYFIIIIGAGHIWKFVTLAYIPPTIAGIIMAYRGRWFLGAAALSCVNKGAMIYLQALGKAWTSTALSLLREIVLGVGLVLLLPVWFGLDGVLYFMAAADAVTFIVTVPVLVRTDRALRG